MSHNNLDDEKLKKMLSNLPDIQDTRSKDEILSRLNNDERLQTEQRKRKSSKRWLPVFVAVAALLVLSLLLPSMLRGNGPQMDSAIEKSSLERNDASDVSIEQRGAVIESTENTDEAAFYSLANANNHYAPAVYPNSMGDSTVFHIGLVSDAAASLPVTFVIPNSQIEEDFGDHKPTSLELYEHYGTRLDEEALGFNNYHPIKGKFIVEKNSLIHQLPKEHGYDIASATLGIYLGVMQQTFYDYDKVIFRNEDGSIVEFSQVGEPSKPLLLTGGVNHYNYYLFTQEDGRQYLSPNFLQSYDSLEEALQAMKKKPNDIYSPIVSSDIQFDVAEENALTKVVFQERLDLSVMDPVEALQMIDGFLLTAASFDVQLQFENVMQDEWNGFDFSKPLEKPMGPNELPLLLK